MNIRHVALGAGKKTMVVVPGLSIGYVTDEIEVLKNSFALFFDDYTVHLFDVRDDVPEGYTILEMADDLVSAIRELNLTNIHLFGCSMGGMESICVAGRYPELVEKIVIGASAMKANSTSRAVIGRWIDLAKRQVCRELVFDIGNHLFTKEICEANREAFGAMADALSEETLTRFIHTAEAIEDFDITNQALAIQCPTLVMGSKGDRVLTAEASAEIAAATGGDFYVYGEEYPHAVYDLAPDFRAKVKMFFD